MTTLKTATLRDRMTGQVVTPDDTGYDEARAVYNAMIDRRPALIARCVDVADVISCGRSSRARQGLPIAVRGGGHNGPGLGSCRRRAGDRPVAMNGVRVDPASAHRARRGRRTWGDVDHATHAFGLAMPAGIISTTGVGGLTLGGGHRPPDPQVRPGDRQPARGRRGARRRAASSPPARTQHPDLFWALRGGGGNFGVVTSLRVPAAPGRHGLRRADALADRARRRGPALVPGLPAGRARRPERLLRAS